MNIKKQILDFWFGENNSEVFGQNRAEWFTKNSEFDELIRNKFLSTYQLALCGEYNEWNNSPEGCLALIILFDQFPRNMFRDTPQAFASDDKALSLTQHAISNHFDPELITVQKWFIYLPFEHSENIENQNKAIELFEALGNNEMNKAVIEFAKKHREVIEKFERFPHRNKILGRVPTPKEEVFLSQAGSAF